MKRLLVVVMVTLVAGCGAEKEEKVELISTSQKASYGVGLQVAQSLATFPVEVDRPAFIAAFNDTLDGKEPRIPTEELTAVFGQLQVEAQKQAQAKAGANGMRGEAFLAENAKKEGVKVTKSGLQYMVLAEGTGKKPVAKDRVTVNYRGTTLAGVEFDSSYKRGKPMTFGVTGVIPGWTEGLQLMTVGSKYKLYVPAHLAYGTRGAGPNIGPNETLIFEVELLSINP